MNYLKRAKIKMQFAQRDFFERINLNFNLFIFLKIMNISKFLEENLLSLKSTYP